MRGLIVGRLTLRRGRLRRRSRAELAANVGPEFLEDNRQRIISDLALPGGQGGPDRSILGGVVRLRQAGGSRTPYDFCVVELGLTSVAACDEEPADRVRRP